MQVDPAKLLELAESSERVLAEMQQDWAGAAEELASACDALGDASGVGNLASSYADSLADAGDTLVALSEAFGLGISGLVAAAQDAVRTDDTVAFELCRAAHQFTTDTPGGPAGTDGR